MNKFLFLLLVVALMMPAPMRAEPDDKKKPAEIKFTVKNKINGHRQGVIIKQKIQVPEGPAILVDKSGREIFYVVGKDKKSISFVDHLPAKKSKKYILKAGQKPMVEGPDWKISTTKSGSEYGSIDNGLFVISVQERTQNEYSTVLEIKSKKGDYVLRFSPHGRMVGCIDDKKYAAEIEDQIREHGPGNSKHPQIFNLFFGIPGEITVNEDGPFRRLIKIKCLITANKNNGEKVKALTESTVEIAMDWKSNIIRISNHRKIEQEIFNHNGFMLNGFFIKKGPVKLNLEGTKAVATSPESSGAPQGVKFKSSMVLWDGDSITFIHQPDFNGHAIYRPRVVYSPGSLRFFISQSWLQGWKPIPVKPKDYDDRIYLALDAGTANNKFLSLKNWESLVKSQLD